MLQHGTATLNDEIPASPALRADRRESNTSTKFKHGLLQLMIHTIDPMHDGKWFCIVYLMLYKGEKKQQYRVSRYITLKKKYAYSTHKYKKKKVRYKKVANPYILVPELCPILRRPSFT